nr:hypothetical protein [Tanacetum cinerariifolium]
VQLLGYCNGLLYILEDNNQVINSLVAIHPMKKQRYELPPFLLPFDGFMFRESCGLGLDSSTNTFKIVCIFLKARSSPKTPDLVWKNLCTMVHVFGMNSWQEIPQVPCCLITGKAVFANGCLFWLTSFIDRPTHDGGRDVIWFDIKTNGFWVNKSSYNNMWSSQKEI